MLKKTFFLISLLLLVVLSSFVLSDENISAEYSTSSAAFVEVYRFNFSLSDVFVDDLFAQIQSVPNVGNERATVQFDVYYLNGSNTVYSYLGALGDDSVLSVSLSNSFLNSSVDYIVVSIREAGAGSLVKIWDFGYTNYFPAFFIRATNVADDYVLNFSASIFGDLTFVDLAAEYVFEWDTSDSAGSNDGVLNGYTINDGSLNGGVSTGVAGATGMGEAVSFDGTGYIDLNSAISLDLENGSSLSFWAKKNSTTDFMYIIGSSFTDSFSYLRFTSGGHITMESDVNGDTCDSALNDNDLNWHYYTFSIGNDNICNFYQDGNLLSYAGDLLNNSLNFNRIGKGSSFAPFNGSLDELRLDFTLTPTQINQSMVSHYPIEPTILSYSFESYNATHVLDTNWNVNGTDGGGAISFDGVDDYVDLGNDQIFNFTTSPRTYTTWVKPKGTARTSTIITNTDASNQGDFLQIRADGFSCYFNNGTTQITNTRWGSFVWDDSTWYHLVCSWDGSGDVTSCIDGVCQNSFNVGSTATQDYNGLFIGKESDGGAISNVTLSNVKIFDKALSSSEVLALYENNSIDSLFFSTVNGTVNTGIQGLELPLINISFSSTQSGGYFDSSVLNVNASSDYVFSDLYQAVTRVYANEIITNSSLSGFNVSDDLGLVSEAISTYAEFNTLAGNRTYTIDKVGYYNVSSSLIVSALANYSSLTVYDLYDHVLNVFSTDALTNVSLSNFSIYLSNGSYESNKTTTGNNVSYNLLSRFTYNLVFDKPTYALYNATINNLTGLASNYTFSAFTTNSININFYDAETLVLMNNTNITSQFIGATKITRVTSNGSLYVDLLSPSDYTILFDATGYNQGKYYLGVSNRTNQDLNLYLTNSSVTSLILVSVFDKFGTPLSAAEVTIQRYKDDSWLTDQILTTDFNGQTEGYYFLSDTFYNHVIEYDGETYIGAVNDDASKKLIFAEDVSNGLKFYVDLLGGSDLASYQESYDYVYNLSFFNTSNVTGRFRFYFADPSNAQVTGCLYLYDSSMSLVNSSCVTDSNGIINLYRTSNSSALFYAFGVVEGYTLDSLSAAIGVDIRDSVSWGSWGYFFALILVLGGFFWFADNPTISVLFGASMFVLCVMLGLIFDGLASSLKVGLGIMAIAFLVAFIRSKNGVNA